MASLNEKLNLLVLNFAKLAIVSCLLAISSMPRAQLASTGWPKFRGNGANSGLSSGSGTTSNYRFVTELANTTFSSPSVGLNGMVYLGAGEDLVALDGSSGALKWTFQCSSPVYSSPAVAHDGTIYFCDMNNLYAVNGATGAQFWSYPVTGSVYGSPAIGSDGTIYFGEILNSPSKGRFFAVLPNGSLKWSVNSGGIVSSAAIGSNGLIYFGSCDNGVYALKPGDGSTAYSFATGDPIQSAPSIAPDGTVIVYSGDGNVYALDSALRFLWSYGTDIVFTYSPLIVSSPAIGPDGSIYVGTLNGTLLSLSKSGTLNWTFQTALPGNIGPSSIQSSVAIGSDGTIYLGPADTNVYSLDTTGQVNWKVNVGNSSEASPALSADGTLYVCTTSGVAAFASVLPTSITLNPVQVLGGSSAVGTISLNGVAPPEGVTVSISCSDPSAVVPTSVFVPGGQSSASFAIQTSPVSTPTSATISCTLNGEAVKATLAITTPALVSVSVTPIQIIGGNAAQGTVSINTPAPTGGLTVSLSSSNGAITLPISVNVGVGKTSSTFAIQTNGVASTTSATLTALLGSSTKTASVSILPASVVGLAFDPKSVAGPATAKGTITLNGFAPPGGAKVSISSSVKCALVPSSATVPAGSTTTSFSVKTITVTKPTVSQINVSYAGAAVTTAMEVDPVLVSSLTLNPPSVGGGSSSVATVTLNGAAPSPGSKITLSSSNLAAKVPTSVTVATGQTSASFTVSTSAVSSSTAVQIKATLNGASSISTLSVTPSVLLGLSFSPSSVVGGNGVTGTITLTGVAGPGGTVVSLTSSDPTAIVGKSVTIAQGTNSASFDIQTIGVSSASSAVIQATNGNVAVRSTLTILPSSLMSVSMNPRRIAGGLSGIGVVTLTGFAPPGGTTVSLSSSSGIVQVPSTITIRSGQSTATFIFQTQSRSDSAVVTISASAGSTVSTALYVYPSWLLSVSVFPTKVIGGAMATGKVTLVGTAPYGGSVITLTSSDPSVTMPSSITIPAGQSSVTFQIHTNIGADNLSVLINAQSESGDTATTTLTIQV